MHLSNICLDTENGKMPCYGYKHKRQPHVKALCMHVERQGAGQKETDGQKEKQRRG